MHRKKIKDIYSLDYISDAGSTFFNVLGSVDAQSQPLYPLVHDFINSDNAEDINYDYCIGHSADKYISSLFEKIIETKGTFNSWIANLIYRRFGEKWKRIYDALMQEYNPLENYSMEEIRTPDLTTDETQNEKTDLTTERETSASNSYKGFNATDPVVVNQTDGDETTTTTGAKADNEVSKKIEQTGTETLTRSGNIGVTTSQQMLESEFKVRQYDFYKMVYNDIDSILCLSIY